MDIDLIISKLTLAMPYISTAVVVFDKVFSGLTQRAQFKLECKKINYSHKIECYSELLALFLDRNLTGETNIDDYLHRLNKATAQAKMFCSDKTQPYIERLISQLQNDRFSENGKLNEGFFFAFQECVNAFRKEIE